jgi:hypothetical protein
MNLHSKQVTRVLLVTAILFGLAPIVFAQAAAPATPAPAATVAPVAPAPAAAAPADQADEAQALIDSLIEDLTGADDAARQKAQKQLVGMGDLAIAPLQTYLRGTHLPVSRQRVQAVLDELETHFKFQPTLVTIKMDNVHPREVFKEFSKIGGMPIEPQWDFWTQGGYGNLPKKVSIDIKDQPFWPALLDFTKKAKVTINNGGSERQIYLYPGGGGGGQYEGPRFVSGPIVFVLGGISRNIWYNNGPTPNKSMNIQFHALMDPKLSVLDGSYEVKLTQADGDKGGSLMPPQRNDNSRTSGNGWQWYLNAGLVYESGNNTKISTLKGSVRYRIRSGVDKIEIPDIINATGKTATAGGWTVKIKSIKQVGEKNNTHWELVIAADSDKAPDPNEGYQYPQGNSMQLLGPNGEQFDHYGNSINGNPQHMEFALQYGMRNRGVRRAATQPVSVQPAKFVWEVTTGTRNIRVPVEFSDIPLPGQEPK